MILIKLFLFISLVYIAGGFFLFCIQRKFVFDPDLMHAKDEFDFDSVFKEYFIKTPSGNRLNSLLFSTSHEEKKGVVIYFHGNSHDLNLWGLEAPTFTDLGYDVLMYDYPNFGKSTGELQIKSLLNDARFITKKHLKDYGRVVLYGRSLGTGIATYVASKNDFKYDKLILETPYYSMSKMAETFIFIYPVKLILQFKIKTFRMIKNVKCPIFAFHGTKDELIPIKQARRLKIENPLVHLTEIENGSHNDLPLSKEYQNKIASILA